MMRNFLLTVSGLVLAFAAPVRVYAWGCEGHQIVALIALKHLQPQVSSQVSSLLITNPPSATLRHYCRVLGLPAIAEASTWADDFRSEQPDTGPYHFIDIPLAATRDNYEATQVCQQACVVEAISKFIQQLKSNTDPKARADALRFVIHFLGDIHQPLHDETNGDRGGNCVPVEYADEAPRQTNREHEDFFPNLHAVWDTEIIQAMLVDHDMTLEEFADFLDNRYRPRVQRWNSGQPIDWAWEGHDAAVAAYRALPAGVPHDNNIKVDSCADNNRVGQRMFDLHIALGQRYEAVSRPIIEEQLTKAGIRLAALLNTTLGK